MSIISSSISQSRRKNSKRKEVGTTISVMGVKKCVGVTNIAIAIGHYLRSLGFRVAILELNRENHFSCIEDKLGINNGVGNGFRYKGVDYYKEVEEEKLLDLICLNYDYFVFDVGTGRNAVKEIIRADCKIAVGLDSEWRSNEVIEFFSAYEKEEWIKQIKFILNLSNKTGENRWSLINANCFYITYIWNKFKVKPEIRQLFRRIIGLD